MSLTGDATKSHMAMLQTINLRKTFGQTVALEGLNISVKPSETLCLLGANGAGKTTTINLFLGFLEPTSGEALVNGRNVAMAPVESKRDIAYIPEQVALYSSLSGLENLKYFAALAGHGSYTDTDLYDFIARAGLTKRQADQTVDSYSKGMRQKIGIATALAKKAKAFLLDAANEFARLAEELRDSGAAILMATHDIFRATELASRIGIMKAGRLVEELDPKTVHNKEIEAIYLNHMRDGNSSLNEGEAA
jgi:ABC-2 type transport system ATP-binding protein